MSFRLQVPSVKIQSVLRVPCAISPPMEDSSVRGELRRERVSKTKEDGESSEVTKIAFGTLGRSSWTITDTL